MRAWEEQSIRVEVRRSNLREEPENAKVVEACFRKLGYVRVRINIGFYGPGTEEKPSPRYWWALGESATIDCRNPEVAGWFREELLKWIGSMDGVVLEVVDAEG